MKKLIAFVVVAAMLVLAGVGCSGGDTKKTGGSTTPPKTGT